MVRKQRESERERVRETVDVAPTLLYTSTDLCTSRHLNTETCFNYTSRSNSISCNL